MEFQLFKNDTGHFVLCKRLTNKQKTEFETESDYWAVVVTDPEKLGVILLQLIDRLGS